MIDDATETTTIRPLTEDELHAVAGGFSLDYYLQGVVEVVTGIKDRRLPEVVTGIQDVIESFKL
jgi:hypothetical protein